GVHCITLRAGCRLEGWTPLATWDQAAAAFGPCCELCCDLGLSRNAHLSPKASRSHIAPLSRIGCDPRHGSTAWQRHPAAQTNCPGDISPHQRGNLAPGRLTAPGRRVALLRRRDAKSDPFRWPGDYRLVYERRRL